MLNEVCVGDCLMSVLGVCFCLYHDVLLYNCFHVLGGCGRFGNLIVIFWADIERSEHVVAV